jgi:hypothetical protein
MGKRFPVLVLLAVLMMAGCSNEIDPPGPAAPLPPPPEIPMGLKAAVGDGLIELSWGVNNPAAVSRYKVYYADTASVDKMRILDSTTQTGYTVRNLANGRRYYFQVSAVATTGLEGEPSPMLAAAPGLFSISIAGGHRYTNVRTVAVGITAPSGTTLVQLAEDSSFASGQWENFALTKTFELSDGDGTKIVYARFQMDAGGSSAGHAADSIMLDRTAIIDSVTENSGGRVLGPDSTVLFSVYAREAGGEASVDIVGLGTIALYDDGCCGDRTAGNGVYEFLYRIPVNTELNGAEITGRFTDAAGNEAAAVKAATRMTVTYPPDPVALTGYAVSSREISLDWTRSTISDFSAYRLFRSDTPVADTALFPTLTLVTSLTGIGTTSYRDTGLAEATTYYYRLYVYDTHGNFAGSNVASLETPVNEAPDPTVLAANHGVDTSVVLTWLECNASDFASYRLLRSTSAIDSYDSTKVITIVNNRATTSYTDQVTATLPVTYLYRLFTFDIQGKWSASNPVTITVTAP